MYSMRTKISQLSEASKEYADLLFYMGIINSGLLVDNPMDLTELLEKLIKFGFGLARDALSEEIDIELDEEEEAYGVPASELGSEPESEDERARQYWSRLGYPAGCSTRI